MHQIVRQSKSVTGRFSMVVVSGPKSPSWTHHFVCCVLLFVQSKRKNCASQKISLLGDSSGCRLESLTEIRLKSYLERIAAAWAFYNGLSAVKLSWKLLSFSFQLVFLVSLILQSTLVRANGSVKHFLYQMFTKSLKVLLMGCSMASMISKTSSSISLLPMYNNTWASEEEGWYV